MEWITGRKSAQLLAGLLTFFVTASAVARDSSVSSSTVNSKIAAWKQMINSQKASTNGGRTLKDLKSQGGPGLDGGGGAGVLMSSGRLRFLDMASYEKRELIPFDDQAYARILLKNGRYVPAAGEVVKSSDFFNCSDKILSAQPNPLLQYLVSKNLDINILRTRLPLELPHDRNISISFLSELGWINNASTLAANYLKSPTYPSELQRPIASYVAQSVNGGGLFEQTLIISSQLYDLLSERDKCALQVHEIFRYVGNSGQLGPGDHGWLLRRALTTQEIESLTKKVMAGDQVFLDEIPASDIYKFFSVATREEISKMSSQEFEVIRSHLKQLDLIAKPDSDEIEDSIETTLILYRMVDRAKLSMRLSEEGIMEIRNVTPRSNQRRLQKKQIDLRSLLD